MPGPGKPAKLGFADWTGIVKTRQFIEYANGLKPQRGGSPGVRITVESDGEFQLQVVRGGRQWDRVVQAR